jgi:hypothetical protein
MKNWIRAALVLFLLSAAVACSKSDGEIPDTRAGLLIFNMIPGDAKFDVLLDTVALGSNLAYGDNTGTYKEFRAQKYDLLIYPAGSRTTPIMAGELNLRNGKNLSAFLTIDRNRIMSVLLTEDNNTPSSIATYAKFRVVDLTDPYRVVGSGSNQQPLPLDIYLNYADEKSIPVFRALTYGAVTGPAEVVGGNYRVDINWMDSSAVLQKAPFVAEAGKVYTLIATGNALRPDSFKLFQYVH